MMKKSLWFLTITICLVSSLVSAQAPGWSWANDNPKGIGSKVVDMSGNIYICGGFGESFVSKFSNSGELLWEKPATGESKSPAGRDYSPSITLDASGNIFIAGYFTSPTLVLGSTTFEKESLLDMFIVKYDANGNYQWAKTAPVGCVGNIGFNIATDTSGNVVVVGSYSALSLTIGTTTLTNPCTFASCTGTGCPSMLVVKYDAKGNVKWVKSSLAGMGTSYSYSVATDASNNIYVGGDFGEDGKSILKYDQDGALIWNQTDGGWYVSVDKSGALYSAYANKNEANKKDAIVKRHDTSNGNIVWTKSSTASEDCSIFSIANDASGNVYLIGHYKKSGITFGATVLDNLGDNDIFIVKYSTSGAFQWAKHVGNSKLDTVLSSAVDSSGNVYVGGFYFSPSLAFDETVLVNSGLYNVFFAKLGEASLGLSDFNNIGADFMIYPNPSSDSLTVELSEYFNSIAEIYNLEGQLVWTQSLTAAVSVIKTESLTKGLYILKLKNQSGVAVKTFVKK